MNAEEIQAIFFAECEESLAAAESGLAACKAGTQDDDTVNAVFRAVHSIKGGAGAFGYVALQAFTHTFETLLSDVREGAVAVTEPLVDLLLRALDTLSDHVGAARGLERVWSPSKSLGADATTFQGIFVDSGYGSPGEARRCDGKRASGSYKPRPSPHGCPGLCI